MMSRGCCEQMQDIFSIQTYFQKIIFKLTLILIYFLYFLFFKQTCCSLHLSVFASIACLCANTIVALSGGCGICSPPPARVRLF